jgi:hypothetical protein
MLYDIMVCCDFVILILYSKFTLKVLFFNSTFIHNQIFYYMLMGYLDAKSNSKSLSKTTN